MNVAVIGTGYVGLITGICLAYKGHKVIAVDVDYDGDNDLVSLGQLPNTFAWFQNDGLDDSGVPILTRYLIESNSTGGWSFATGDMDNNVHPGATYRMANALIKANKKFGFMILPSQRHGFGNMSEYNFWLRANHFSKYFLGDENNSVDMLESNRDIPQSK